MDTHLGAEIFCLRVEEVDTKILVILENAEVSHCLGEMSVCVFQILYSHLFLLLVNACQ